MTLFNRCLAAQRPGPSSRTRPARLMRRGAVATLVGALWMSAVSTVCGQQFQQIPESPFATTQPPTATLGPIQPWDPYAEPSDLQCPTVLPEDNMIFDPNQPLVNQIQLFKQVEVIYTLLGSNGGASRFGANEFEFSTTMQFPLGYQLAPLEVTPGFGLHLWDGPEGAADIPGQTYDAWLDFAWNPVITPWFRAELAVRPGVYTDFNTFDSNSFRIKGKALAIFRTSPAWEIVGGIIYYDRFNIKLLPAGGLIWTPNADTRFEIYFPKPKLASRLTTWGNTEFWWYVGGEYGGDSWTIQRTTGADDGFDYEDLRAYLGVEFLPASGLTGRRGFAEIGFVFDREIQYLSGQRFKPDDTIMFRAGITW